MKNIFKLGLFALVMLFATNSFAQTAADQIVGVYQVEEEGRQSKVRFTKCADGSYQGQIIWLSEPNNADGTRKMDTKNPNPELRKVPADQVVIVYGIRYDAAKKAWSGGKVYKPINGKIYKVECSFDDEKTLRVKGSLGPISLSRYWKKIE
ncbi:MAG: DUF2147 domain-containing protein [Alistipes sp.]|nr:DUF2147 domain-containing protein [Alistipes sp.]